MNKLLISLLAGLLFTACGGSGEKKMHNYQLHKNIVATMFWVGEPSGSDNAYIANDASAWDDEWQKDYGGVDDPNTRDGYYPAGFVPKENPFYFASPFNDFDENGKERKLVICRCKRCAK